METTKRTLLKAGCWQLTGLGVMTALAYLFTGSIAQGGSIAVSSTLIGSAAYFVHERLWARVNWGRIPLRTE